MAEKCNEDEFPYFKLVGSLMNLVTSTRPDYGNIVSELNQFLNCYDRIQWNVYKNVLRYLIKNN